VGTLLRNNGTGWTPTESGTRNTLQGVWGGAANDVWAVGATGSLLRAQK
jgi:hypothetical protein